MTSQKRTMEISLQEIASPTKQQHHERSMNLTEKLCSSSSYSCGSSEMQSWLVGRTLLAVVVVLCCCVQTAASCRGGSILKSGITPDERIQILESHNRLRSSVAQGRVPRQPGAENMREMVWDEELAIKAQQWANQCQFEHDPSRYLDRFTMGQNLAIIWSTIPLADDDGDFPSRIQNWFNEVQKYAWGAKWSPATGHYSQLVWGDTNLVGCGFSYYKDSRRFNKLWVCNYGPGGNVVGSAPYKIGSPSCTNYGMQPSLRYSGLCSTSYASTANYNVNNNNLQNNYVSQNTYTFKTETFNPPTFQLQKPAYTPVQQPQQQQQQQQRQQLPQQQSAVQTAFKPFVQAVVQPVANNLINTDYSFKTIFDRFKDVLRLQHVGPQQSQAAYTQQSGQQQYNYQQQAAYTQPPTTYAQQPTAYAQQPAQQSAYQPQAYQQQAYQQPAVQQTAYQPYYQQQPSQDTRNSAFLTYDWSQLFNNNNNNNNNYQTK